MNICIIGPSKSGKTTLAYDLAHCMGPGATVVDVGQIVRITADEKDQQIINAGQLSSRGDKGTNWVDEIVDKAVANQKDGLIIVGYPRTIDQYVHIEGKGFIIVCHMASYATIASRTVRKRPDDKYNEVKLNWFYGSLSYIGKKVDLWTSTEMSYIQIAQTLDNIYPDRPFTLAKRK